MNELWLFTYGLLTDKSYIGCDAELVGPGILNDHKFELLTHANVIHCENDSVHGIVWNISEEDLSHTDLIEGYPHYYDRTIETIQLYDGSIIPAYVYKMTDSSRKASLGHVPTYGYLDSLLGGYGDMIPTSQLKQAMEDAYKRINN